jgi:hypothetical protein
MAKKLAYGKLEMMMVMSSISGTGKKELAHCAEMAL